MQRTVKITPSAILRPNISSYTIDEKVDGERSDFHAEYLQHMAEEEKETQVLLWEHFTDEELAQHRSEIMKKLKPETLLLWFIIPAQSHDERVALLGGFKAMASTGFFHQAMSVIKGALPPEEWDRLRLSLE